MEGFTYNGKHSSIFGCFYIPNETDRWFASPDFEVYESSDAGKDGGYYYGTKAKIRVFTLQCFFEDITEATREAIRRWLDRGTSGELIFDRRAYAAYNVFPTKITTGKIYAVYHPEQNTETYSGTFTVTFSAYEPYGYLRYKSYDTVDVDGATQACGMVSMDMMPAEPTTADTSFLLYNCGTQPCATVFRLSGTAADGLTITNKTNGTKCELTSFPSTGYLEINSRLGSVSWVHGNVSELAFAYHTEGFVMQDPYMSYDEQIHVSCESGSTTATTDAPSAEMIGKYIYVGGSWNKVTAVSGNTITLENAVAATGDFVTPVVVMNEIEITGDNVTLTRLEADYFPVIV